MSVKVKALQPGFYAGARRRPGEVFTLAEDDTPGRWMEVLTEDEAKQVKPKVQKAKGDGPQTFSEIAKKDAKALTPKGAEDLV